MALATDIIVPSAHFNVVTYKSWVDYEISNPTAAPASIFNPTQYDHWESWLDECVKLGAKTVFFTAHYHEGFCTWTSTTSVYSQRNPACPFHPDMLLDFCRAVRQRGLQVAVYFNIEDKWYEENETGGFTYQQWIVAVLTEVLTNYGSIAYIFFDAWGDHYWADNNGVSYAQVDYTVISNLIHSLQPGCVFSVNDHVHVLTAEGGFLPGDVDLWERPYDGIPANDAASDYSQVALHDPLHKPGPDFLARWYFHSDSPPDEPTDAQDNIKARYLTQRLTGGIYMPNFSPGPLGKMDPSTVSLIKEMWVPDTTPVIAESFVDAGAPKELHAHDANWVKVRFAGDAIINPSGEAWMNGESVYRRTDYTNSNYRIVTKFNFATVPTNCQLFVTGQTNSDGTNGNRTYFIKTGSTVKIALSILQNDGFVATTEDFFTDGLSTGKEYWLVNQKIGDQIRAEFWVPLADGTMQMYCKLFVTDNSLNSGCPGFSLQDTASASTGLHIIDFNVHDIDTTAPSPPTISINGSGHIAFTKPATTKYMKIYRLDSGVFVLVAFIDVVANPGTVDFNDTEVPDASKQIYKATAIDASWNASGSSNVLGAGQRNNNLFVGLTIYG